MTAMGPAICQCIAIPPAYGGGCIREVPACVPRNKEDGNEGPIPRFRG